MNVKLDTKEKFHVINVLEQAFYANMTESLLKTFNDCTQSDVKNVILNLDQVTKMEREAAEALVNLQQTSYENNHSLVICCLKQELEDWLDKEELLELMNVTPTLSEAMDIVQMEEIERDLFKD
ncbi:MAG: STAS domain-containing protein [Sphingobacteriales bacterium]|nr:MAG: STAS domain-containing protein [Sphingobacteriales bacterium]